MLKWLRITAREKDMLSVPKTDMFKVCFQSMAGNGPLITLRKAKATIAAGTGIPVSQPLVRVVLKTLGKKS